MKTSKRDIEGHVMTQQYALCWLCTSSNRRNNMILIFSIEGKKEHLCEKISMYTPFKVEVCSNVSAILCKACVLNINNWHGFVQYCIKAQHDLKSSQAAEKISLTGQVKEISPGNGAVLPTENCLVTSSEPSDIPSCVLPNETESSIMTASNLSLLPGTSLPVLNSVSSSIVTAAVSPLTVIPVKITNPKKQSLKPQGTYCCAKWCRNNAGEHSNLSCFRVPRNRTRAEQWLKNAGREDLLQGSIKLHTKYLCQEHFTKDMFTNSNCNRLVWNAVPTLFHTPRLLGVTQPVKRKILPKTSVRSQPTVSSSTPTVSSRNYKYILPAPAKKSEEVMVHCNVAVKSDEVVTKDKSTPAPEGGDLLVTETQDLLMTEAIQSFITTEMDLPSLESSEPKYTCTFCGEMFLMRSSLIMHQTTYHPDHRVGCELCGQVEYHSRAEFLEHVCVGTNSRT